MSGRQAWIDASAGVAGDMLLGALVAAGADLAELQAAVEAVVPASVGLTATQVTRAGLAACKVDVEMLVDDPPHRTWRAVRSMLAEATLAEPVRDRALAVFARLADAEGQVHGVPAEDVHFHEVGALDSIADVVGVCAALHDLGVDSVSAGRVALGSGSVRTAHGQIPVPVPAVVQLARGWRVSATGTGELTTPTGMALVATLSSACTELPPMALERVGVGAGSKDFPGRANVTRVLIGSPEVLAGEPFAGDAMVLLEANVDDLDPRLWPGVLAALLQAGAADAWLVPIVMKKGRPAHTLSVLGPPERAGQLSEAILARTSSVGIRRHELTRYALPRAWVDLAVVGGNVSVKIAHRNGQIVQVTPEFEAVAALAAQQQRPEADVLAEAAAAAMTAGLKVGEELPSGARSIR